MIPPKIKFLSFFVTLHSALSFAQDAVPTNEKTISADDEIEEVSVIAHYLPVPLSEISLSVTVLDQDALEKIGNPSLINVLSTTPGVNFTQDGGVGQTASLRLRGEEGFRTKILIDGIDTSDTTTPQIAPRLDHLLNSQISRVEILRGPQGMLYGADAAGVVNIISKQAEDCLQADLDLEAGTYRSKMASANIRCKYRWADISLSASDYSSDSINARDDDITGERDPYENQSLHLNSGLAFSKNTGARFIYRKVNGETNWDTSFSNDNQSIYSQKLGKVSVYYQGDKNNHDLSFQKNISNNNSAPYLDAQGKSQQAQYIGAYSFSEELSLNWGLEDSQQEFINLIEDKTYERKNQGIFLEGRVKPSDNFSYSIGARQNNTDDFETNDAYRISSAYIVTADERQLKFHGAFSTGFRLPSLYEVANTAGNEALLTETSEGYELGVRHSSNNHLFGITWFNTVLENEIYYDLITFQGYFQHQGQSHSQGLELESEWQLKSFVLGGNYLWNLTEMDENSDLSGAVATGPRPRRPEHTVNIFAEYRSGETFYFRLAFQRVNDAVDYVQGQAVELGNFQTVNLHSAWQINKLLEVYFRAENILDKDYQRVPSYNTTGAIAFAGIHLSL